MRLLVTGVSGLLGLNLAWLTADRFQVTGVLRGKRAVAVPGRAPFDVVEADLTIPGQIERVLEQIQPDVVVHCAALTELDRCELHPEEAYQTNTMMTGMLARAVARSGARLLHISTDAVFDGSRGGYTEEDAPNPINVYGRTKLEAERLVSEACPDALIARVNFYGWSWQGSRSLAEFFFNNFSAGIPFFGYNDVLFAPLLVNDMVEIFLRMLERQLSGIYHVVSSEFQSKYEFARLLAREFGFDENLVTPASFHTGRLRAPRSPRLNLCNDRLVRALGQEMPDQQTAMRRFVALYHQEYPQILHSIFVASDHTFAG